MPLSAAPAATEPTARLRDQRRREQRHEPADEPGHREDRRKPHQLVLGQGDVRHLDDLGGRHGAQQRGGTAYGINDDENSDTSQQTNPVIVRIAASLTSLCLDRAMCDTSTTWVAISSAHSSSVIFVTSPAYLA